MWARLETLFKWKEMNHAVLAPKTRLDARAEKNEEVKSTSLIKAKPLTSCHVVTWTDFQLSSEPTFMQLKLETARISLFFTLWKKEKNVAESGSSTQMTLADWQVTSGRRFSVVSSHSGKNISLYSLFYRDDTSLQRLHLFQGSLLDGLPAGESVYLFHSLANLPVNGQK